MRVSRLRPHRLKRLVARERYDQAYPEVPYWKRMTGQSVVTRQIQILDWNWDFQPIFSSFSFWFSFQQALWFQNLHRSLAFNKQFRFRLCSYVEFSFGFVWQLCYLWGLLAGADIFRMDWRMTVITWTRQWFILRSFVSLLKTFLSLQSTSSFSYNFCSVTNAYRMTY